MLMPILKTLLYVPLWFLFPTIFKGKRNVPKGRVIFVCNHRSNVDPIIMELSMLRTQYYLSKKELFKNKFIAGFLKRMRTIPIDRKKLDLTAMKQCLKVLNKGKILTIFPEGTRNRTDAELGKIKAGAAMFAIKSKTPIVPVWIKKKPRLFCPNSLRFGKAFELTEFYDKKLDSETLDQAGKIITKHILENKY